MRRTVTTLVVAVMLFATGCDVLRGGDINGNPDAGSREQQYDVLRKRPDIEQITRTYQQLLADIMSTTSERFGLPDWTLGSREEINASGCGEFPGVELREGEKRSIRGGSARANLSDEKWQEALDVVAGLAREKGFTKGPGILIDRPGEHVVEFYDTRYGALLSFGTKLRTTLSISTGCHLTPEVHGGGRSDANQPEWPPAATPSGQGTPDSGNP